MKSYTLNEIKELSQKHPIIAFDGVCNFCNRFINWLIKKDRQKVFRYTTLQSDLGKSMDILPEVKEDSVILAYKGKVFTMSDASLESMKILGGGWSILSWLALFPKSFRDAVYKIIARNRYKWFGKRDSCMIPNKEIQSLFL